MKLIFISRFQRGGVQRNDNNLFKHEKVFHIIGIVLPYEQTIKSFRFIFQGFCLNFMSIFTIFKEFMNDFWRTPHNGCFFQ